MTFRSEENNTMYKITRSMKRFNNKTFPTYEQARSYVRKWLRKHYPGAANVYSNHSINDFGFAVVKA
jgi:hypothetical protein